MTTPILLLGAGRRHDARGAVAVAVVEEEQGRVLVVRIQREEKREGQLNPVSKWNETTMQLTLYLSNLSGSARTVAVTERLPVSEIEHVKVELDREKTTGAPVLDENGVCTWKVELPANGHGRLFLAYKMSTAPGVQSA